MATTNTDDSGEYSFTGMPVGEYIIEQTQPELYVTTTSNSVVVELSTDEVAKVDLGEIGSTVAGVVWNDGFTPNGIQDSQDAPVPDVNVRLLDADGEVIATIATDAGGSYEFADLPAGDYQVELELADVLDFTAADVGNDDRIDSDFSLASSASRANRLKLEPGTDVRDLDAGVIRQPVDLGVIVVPSSSTIADGDIVNLTTGLTNTGQTTMRDGGLVEVVVPPNLRIDIVEIVDGWDVEIVENTVTGEWTGTLESGESSSTFIIRTTVTTESPGTFRVTAPTPPGYVDMDPGNNITLVTLTPVARPFVTATPAPATSVPTTVVAGPTAAAVQVATATPVPPAIVLLDPANPVLGDPVLGNPVPESLAFTGSSATQLAVGGLALILVGAAAIIFARRRELN